MTEQQPHNPESADVILISPKVKEQLLGQLLAVASLADVQAETFESEGRRVRVFHRFSNKDIARANLLRQGIKGVEVSLDSARNIAHVQVFLVVDLETTEVSQYTLHRDSLAVPVTRFEYSVDFEEQFAKDQLEAVVAELEQQVSDLTVVCQNAFDQACMNGLELELPEYDYQTELKDKNKELVLEYDRTLTGITEQQDSRAIDAEVAEELRRQAREKLHRQQTELSDQYLTMAEEQRAAMTHQFWLIRDQFPELYTARIQHEQALQRYQDVLQELRVLDQSQLNRIIEATTAAEQQQREWCTNVEAAGVVSVLKRLIKQQ